MLGMGPILWRQAWSSTYPGASYTRPRPYPREVVCHYQSPATWHPAALLYYKALDRVNLGFKPW